MVTLTACRRDCIRAGGFGKFVTLETPTLLAKSRQ